MFMLHIIECLYTGSGIIVGAMSVSHREKSYAAFLYVSFDISNVNIGAIFIVCYWMFVHTVHVVQGCGKQNLIRLVFGKIMYS